MRARHAARGWIRDTTLTLACVLLLALVPASAQAGWGTPTVVSGGGSSTSQTRIAGGTDGSSWVIWIREVGGFDVIQGTRVATDGTQGPIITLSAPNANASEPLIESRADGSALVAWLNRSAPDDTVTSRSIAADGTLGPIHARSAPGPAGQPARDVAIALGGDGTAGIAWRKLNGLSWVVQTVKVLEDGSSGAIQDISDPSRSATSLDIGASQLPPPGRPPAPTVYGVVWTGGSGVNGNVFGRQSSPDGTFPEPFQALWPYVNPNWPEEPDGVGTGGDPHSIQIGYERDGSVNIVWIRDRTDWQVNGVPDNSIDLTANPPVRDRPDDDPDDTPFNHEAVERIRLAGTDGLTPLFPAPGRLPPVVPVTPVVQNQPYEVRSLFLSVPVSGWPAIAWVREVDGGGSRIATGRIVLGGTIRRWADPAGASTGIYERPVLDANRSEAAVLGWGLPAVVPDQYNWRWSRFSNTSPPVDFVPTDLYSMDVGSVLAASGETTTAYTGIDAGFVGSSKVVTYSAPGIVVNPTNHNFGAVRIGREATVSTVIRSSGETTSQVTGVSLSGPDVSQFGASNAIDCVKSLGSGDNCRIDVTFKPQSVGAKTARVTVTSDVGVFTTDLVGSGLDQTQNRLTVTPRNRAVRGGRVVPLRVRAVNTGGTASRSTRVCVRYNKRVLRLAGNRCRNLGSLAPGASRNLNFRIRVTWRARQGARIPVMFRMNAGNAVVRQAVANLRRRGR